MSGEAYSNGETEVRGTITEGGESGERAVVFFYRPSLVSERLPAPFCIHHHVPEVGGMGHT